MCAMKKSVRPSACGIRRLGGDRRLGVQHLVCGACGLLAEAREEAGCRIPSRRGTHSTWRFSPRAKGPGARSAYGRCRGALGDQKPGIGVAASGWRPRCAKLRSACSSSPYEGNWVYLPAAQALGSLGVRSRRSNTALIDRVRIARLALTVAMGRTSPAPPLVEPPLADRLLCAAGGRPATASARTPAADRAVPRDVEPEESYRPGMRPAGAACRLSLRAPPSLAKVSCDRDAIQVMRAVHA